MKTVVITPAYSHAHHGLLQAIQKSGLPWLPLYEHSDLVRVRSLLLTLALRSEAERIVLVDADVVPGDGDLEACAAAATPAKAVFGVYLLRDGKRLSVEPLDGELAKKAFAQSLPFPIVYGGLGLCAIHRASLARVFERLPAVTSEGDEWRPFCLPFVDEAGVYHADDRSLCARLRESGTELWCDPRLRPGHAVARVVRALRD